MEHSMNLNRWTVGASIEKLIKDEGCATRVRAVTAGPMAMAMAMIVIVVDRTFGPNIPCGCMFCLV
jgi:hypothetical protein